MKTRIKIPPDIDISRQDHCRETLYSITKDVLCDYIANTCDKGTYLFRNDSAKIYLYPENPGYDLFFPNNILNFYKIEPYDTKEIIDGHNIEEITNILLEKNDKKPLCIVANTIKGFGITEIENDVFSWHHRSPNHEELQRFLGELNNK